MKEDKEKDKLRGLINRPITMIFLCMGWILLSVGIFSWSKTTVEDIIAGGSILFLAGIIMCIDEILKEIDKWK